MWGYSAEEWGKYNSQIDECLKKRSEWQEKTITAYVCPGGDFISLEGRTFVLTGVNVAYQVVTSLMFNELDEKVRTYFKTLDTERSKNYASWTEEIRAKFDKANEKSEYPAKYKAICTNEATSEIIKWAQWSKSTDAIATNTMIQALNTDTTFNSHISDSSYACSILVDRKMIAFSTMAMMIASQSVSKSYQNDKSIYADTLKGAYGRLLETARNYAARLSIAVGKFDKFVTTPSIAPN
jgi:hypothetical protein